ncbi:hypothetical protein LB526_01975 [Mesorhizobium sp. CA6]|uniref:hypothetical protein n=1 Tax=Mesorhizobium sp. CA6 TaxID=588500 RepID=UPI001CCF5A97|nr:hypothetical protein [Mesorhizobium sp. CA6]MBZ9765528.1 hypothetical protein [Mesorhizobium sp. CA6]
MPDALRPFSASQFRIMFRRVTDAQIVPPIALALVVSFVWFVVAYRLYKRDLPLGPNNAAKAIA